MNRSRLLFVASALLVGIGLGAMIRGGRSDAEPVTGGAQPRDAISTPVVAAGGSERSRAASSRNFLAEADAVVTQSGGLRNWRKAAFLLQWAELDPEGMIAWASEQDGLEMSAMAWNAWGTIDLETAWAHAGESLEKKKSIFLGASSGDLGALFRWIEANDSTALESTEINRVLVFALPRLTKTEPEFALELLDRYRKEDYGMGSALFSRTFEEFGERDPQAALAAAQEFGGDAVVNALLGAVANDPDWVIARLGELEDKQLSRAAGFDHVARKVAEALAPHDLERALEIARGLQAEDRDGALLACAVALADTDRERALDLLAEVGAGLLAFEEIGEMSYEVRHIRRYLIGDLVETEPMRAVQLAMSDVGLLSEVLTEVGDETLMGMARNPQMIVVEYEDHHWVGDATSTFISTVQGRSLELQEAIEAALPPGDLRDRFSSRRADDLIEEVGMERALVWEQGLGSEDATVAVWERFATVDPELALARLDDEEDSERRLLMLRGLVEGLEETAPVLELLEENPEFASWSSDVFALSLAERVLDRHVEQDLEQVADWFSTLPDGLLRDVALDHVIERLGDIDSDDFHAESAMRWAATHPWIGFHSNWEKAFNYWLYEDEAAARQFAREADMPEELRENLLETP